MQNIKFDWNDISIIPAPISKIRSRSEITPFYNNNKLPLIISPMDTVINEENINTFLQLGYEVCVPRGVNNKYEEAFTSYGLDEITEIFSYNLPLPKKVLIDVANGHSIRILELAQEIKNSYPDTLLMIGNIANPETYKEYCKIGVDYVRVGIGGGCFIPSAEVCTKNGLISLENIKEGDFVLTHKGFYREVLQKHYFHKTEQMIRVNDLPLCTKNHEFLVIKIDDFENYKPITKSNYLEYAKWISADYLNTQKHMLVNINNFDLSADPDDLNFEIVPIESIYFEFYNGIVIDLTVKEDESYNIEGTIVHNSACHTGETIIKTINGDKKLEDIIVNDEVLTHKGNYNKVNAVHILQSNNLYQLNNNTVTGDHKYYVIDKKYENIVNDDNIHEYAEWISVDKLNDNYFLLSIN